VARRGNGIGPTYRGDGEHFAEIAAERRDWLAETERWRARPGAPLRQAVAVGIINDLARPDSVVINAAGTLPADLQKLWRDKDPAGKGYLVEYGYSTMGFELPAGIGAKLALPARQVLVLVGDMSFLIMAGELVTAAQLGLALTVVIFDNHGGQSIRGLQRRSGFQDHGMEYRRADGSLLPLDFASMAEGMCCRGLRADDAAGLRRALEEAESVRDRPTVIDLKVDSEDQMPGYGAWWDVPQPEVVDGKASAARAQYLKEKARQVIR
jgi:3D-(3,5/4)-trihydroxycyclohexane-1,2-dione acylhydrolase (decyclizing)